MLIWSISSAVTSTTAHAVAYCSIFGRRNRRSFSVSCFESLSSSNHSRCCSCSTNFGSSTTAAANTLPANGPRPASSQPASTTPSMQYAFSMSDLLISLIGPICLMVLLKWVSYRNMECHIICPIQAVSYGAPLLTRTIIA